MIDTLSFNREDLKIEFRAVPYLKKNESDSPTHVLQFRLSPDQDLTYYEEHNFLGIFKRKRKKEYSTHWNEPVHFENHIIAYRLSEYDEMNWFPFFITNKSDLDFYKENFKTIGEFIKYKEEINQEEKEKWLPDRKRYLEETGTWY